MLSIILKASKLSSLTRSLMGVGQDDESLWRNRKENEKLRRMSLMVEGSVSTLEQCMRAPSRREISKLDRVERSGRIIGRTNAVSRQEREDGCLWMRPKRRMVSPAEGNKVTAVTKRPRKGEPSYAEVCGRRLPITPRE